MNNDFRNGRHCVYKLTAHIILTPKYRKKVMTDIVSKSTKNTTLEVLNRLNCNLIEFKTDKDHAHLLIEYPPKLSLSKIIMLIKTNTSKILREKYKDEIKNKLYGKHFWSPSYCVLSTGGAIIETIKKYIQNQKNPNRPKGNPKWQK